MQDVLDELGREWWIYLSMPVIAAVIGYVTKVAAIEMMFRPVEFVGIKPILGWQGVVPRYADRMARTAVEILTGRLLKPEELVARLDLDEILVRIEEPMRRLVEEMLREVAARHLATLWESLPLPVQQMVIQRVQDEAPMIVERVFADLRANSGDVLNLEEMAVEVIVRDKPLLNKLIRDVAQDELNFIVRSGIFFGLCVGMVQAIGWALTGSHLVMPLFGAFTGLFSDWLALTLIFRPIHRRRILKIFPWQGKFHQRRQEVSASYATVIAQEVLTPAHLIEGMLMGPSGDRLFAFVHREVERAVNERAGWAKPAVVAVIGGDRLQEVKQDIVRTTLAKTPTSLEAVEPYVADSLDLRNFVEQKMKLMTAEEYEDLLRPAFKQDEWKLIAVGAILGFLVGELQLLVVLQFA